MTLFLKQVEEKDIQILRRIRNDCRYYMTRNQKYITEDEQSKWFANFDKEKLIPYLVNQDIMGVAYHSIGYGILRIEDDRGLVTGGILEEYRGIGAGKFVFQELINICLEKKLIPALEVLKTNTRAFNLYLSLGFKIINENEYIYYMEMI